MNYEPSTINLIQMQEAYIVAGYRTAVTKSKKGGFRFTRPDDLAIDVIKGLLASVPQLDPKQVDDVIVGNAVPEAEQGLQVGRIIAARAVGFMLLVLLSTVIVQVAWKLLQWLPQKLEAVWVNVLLLVV